MRRAGVRTFAEAENYEADRKRRALEEGGARGDRAHARHRGRADEDDPAILAQVLIFHLGTHRLHFFLWMLQYWLYAQAPSGQTWQGGGRCSARQLRICTVP